LSILERVRISEALSLKTKDVTAVDDQLYELRIKGKGNKHRTAFIKRDIIEQHIESFGKYKNVSSDLFAPNPDGNMLSQSYTDRVIEKILTHAGIRKDKNGAHMLRHSFATLL
jgi:integrase/recombinase XerD